VTVFLEHVAVEEVALQRIVASSVILNPFNEEWRLLIHSALSLSISRTKSGIVGTREEMVADARVGMVMCIGPSPGHCWGGCQPGH
jgi:hypothetical protein